MKIKKILTSLLIIYSTTLSSCSITINDNDDSLNSSSNQNNSSLNISNSNSSNTNSNTSSSQGETTYTGAYLKKDVNVGSQLSIYSINDFHGKIAQDSNYYGIEAEQGGIISNPYYDESTSLIISSGDMWQGSYLSGAAKGIETTKLMNSFPFVSMTLGNHEFDWGFSNILENAEVADFPFLCANLIDKSTGKRPDGIYDHLLVEYNNYKVGIVGVIGSELESSIKESMLENYYFSSEQSLVNSAYNACINEGANVVVLSVHDDQDSTYVNALQTYQHDKFIGIFGGHSHSFQLEQDTSIVPYVQGGSDSRGFSYININTQTNTLSDINYTWFSGSTTATTYTQYAKTTFSSLVDDLIAKYPLETLGYLQGNWTKEQTANLVLKAMFDAVKTYRPDKEYTTENLISIHNRSGIRGVFPTSSNPLAVTMDDVQIVSPFDNEVMFLPSRPIAMNSYNYYYPSVVESDAVIDIVTIDYLVSDKYNKEMFTPTGAEPVKGANADPYIIYDCVADYIKKYSSESNPLKATDYNS